MLPDITWHGERLDEPPWFEPQARQLAFTLAGSEPNEPTLHVILDMLWEPLTFQLPGLPQGEWRCAVDTALDSPHDILPPDCQAACAADHYVAQPRSVVVLEQIARQ